MSNEPDPLPAGFRLGQYEIERQIGVGPMGRVYRGYDGQLNQHVAIYVLRPSLRSGLDLARFTRWARKAAHGDPGANSPCDAAVLPLLNVGAVDGIDFAVLMCAQQEGS